MLLLLIFSENSLRDGFPEDAPVVMYQLRKEPVPWQWGKPPPHVAVETISEERVLWPTGTKQYTAKYPQAVTGPYSPYT